jgi:hypothetical protein
MTRTDAATGPDGGSTRSGTVLDRVLDADGGGDANPLRPTAWTGVVLVLVSTAVSVLASGVLPAQMRIRWTIGTYYGPEFAPTAVVLWAFPIAVAATYLGFRVVARYLERAGEPNEARVICEVVTLAVVGLLVLTQVGLVAANLP